jgi:mono/diheme cytochrome c family protein
MNFRTITALAGFFVFVLAGSALASDGAATFAAKCGACHGADGKADTKAAQAMKVPALAGDAKVAGMSVEEVVALIKENPKHKGPISSLSEEDLTAVATHVKGLAGSAAAAAPDGGH